MSRQWTQMKRRRKEKWKKRQMWIEGFPHKFWLILSLLIVDNKLFPIGEGISQHLFQKKMFQKRRDTFFKWKAGWFTTIISLWSTSSYLYLLIFFQIPINWISIINSPSSLQSANCRILLLFYENCPNLSWLTLLGLKQSLILQKLNIYSYLNPQLHEKGFYEDSLLI